MKNWRQSKRRKLFYLLIETYIRETNLEEAKKKEKKNSYDDQTENEKICVTYIFPFENSSL